MITLHTITDKIPADTLRDGDWVIGDFGDQLVLLRYQDSLVQGDFKPIVLTGKLLLLLGFERTSEEPEGSEADIYIWKGFRISVINDREFIFESSERGRIDVPYLHLLQQTWRQIVGEELANDLLEQPHTVEVLPGDLN